MDFTIKNMKEFSGYFFFELVVGDVIGIRGWKLMLDTDGNYELKNPERQNKRGIYTKTTVLYDNDTYDEILELALIELSKLTDGEVIK